MATDAPRSEIAEALRSCRSAFLGIALLSGVINVLYLTGSFFMLEVYDRVLPSRSIPTLVGLVVIAGTLFAFLGVLDLIRARVLVRIGLALDEALSPRVYDTVVRLPLKTRAGGDGLQSVRDLDQVRSFLSGLGPVALFDLPWMPLYLAICFAFHVWIGVAALAGAIVLVALTLMTELLARAPSKDAAVHAATRNALAEASRRNAEVVQAMGMGRRLYGLWSDVKRESEESARGGGGGGGAPPGGGGGGGGGPPCWRGAAIWWTSRGGPPAPPPPGAPPPGGALAPVDSPDRPLAELPHRRARAGGASPRAAGPAAGGRRGVKLPRQPEPQRRRGVGSLRVVVMDDGFARRPGRAGPRRHRPSRLRASPRSRAPSPACGRRCRGRSGSTAPPYEQWAPPPAILTMRARGSVVIIVAHRPQRARERSRRVDQVLVMAEGRVQAFGPKDEVLARVTRPPPAPPLAVVPQKG
ncbi:MAG: hypothetical protein M5U07_25055 [Xanthobacteraceae bacterium]|nr:hypothetical protein [Xanthobacteraceae bacterium]